MAIAVAAAPSSIGSNLPIVLVTIRPGFKLGNVLTIRVGGHDDGPIIEVAGLRTDTEPGDVNKVLVLLHDINDAAKDNKNATEQPPDKGI